jgi:hypothetical protein
MQKHHTKNTRVSRLTNRRREAIRYVPIPPVAADVVWERFFDYEQRLSELEEHLTRQNALKSIDIDRL